MQRGPFAILHGLFSWSGEPSLLDLARSAPRIVVPHGALIVKLLLVYKSLVLGGLETLVVRVSNWFCERGDDVTIVLLGQGPLDCLLSQRVTIVNVGEMTRLFSRSAVASRCSGLVDQSYDAVLAFDPVSLWMSVFLSRYLKNDPRFLIGVYHPRIYFFEEPDPPFLKLARAVFDRYVADSSKYFMNEPTRREHERRFGRSFRDAAIVPLPVDVRRFELVARRPVPGRLVSVGRLTAFKSYNLFMIDVVEELTRRGHRVEWHVYGEGELEWLMRERIQQRHLERSIFLHGALPYPALETALESAYCFVGMGTALIEAGAAGVPSVPAIVGEGAMSYGFLPDLPYFAVGERLPSVPDIPVVDLLAQVLSMRANEYDSECRRTQVYCRAYSIETIGPSLSSLLEGQGGTCRRLREVPPSLRVLCQGYWIVRRVVFCGKDLVVRAVKAALPRPLYGWLQRCHRRRFAQGRLRAEGVSRSVAGNSR